MDTALLDRRLAALFPAPPPSPGGEASSPSVYAVLDGARDDRIYKAVYESRLEYECLFAGELPYQLTLAAPYLVRLDAAAPFTRWLLEEGFGRSFGVFAWSGADIEALRRHFRRLLQVKDEDGKKLYFRFYDPRVLRVYLPTCSSSELKEVFGPVGRFVVEGAEGQALAYERGGRPLRVIESLPGPRALTDPS